MVNTVPFTLYKADFHMFNFSEYLRFAFAGLVDGIVITVAEMYLNIMNLYDFHDISYPKALHDDPISFDISTILSHRCTLFQKCLT